ncbi:MAG: NADH-quinone oxidoreductase subunit J [Deltaproteobacteria bacterium]|nr:NADH-quinone oxidoreductase subunit J [Candidatus Anaeroferrophillus wilburensis]MBN2889219.1 NADH-quinone oxidoreductase subunit J [Deltaproteobacteria bacterium]
MELIILLICGGLTIVTSLLVIFSSNTVHSALWMVASFFTMAILYLLLRAEFIAILQIIVYAGAIMMFILFAIMMLNLRQEEGDRVPVRKTKVVGVIFLLVLFLEMMVVAVGRGVLAMKGPVTDQLVEKFGHVAVLSNFLFSDYILPFEVASLLLTAGVVGAVVLAKQKK